MKLALSIFIILFNLQYSNVYAEVDWRRKNTSERVNVKDMMDCVKLAGIKIKEFTSDDGNNHISFSEEPSDSNYMQLSKCMIDKKYYAKHVTKWVQNKPPYLRANNNDLMTCLNVTGLKIKKFNYETGAYDADGPDTSKLYKLTSCMNNYGYLPY